ncbi:MAG: S41 family peptidase [Rikenellaceae bacterium]|jgi:carboxyl-terminal processing protease|nr:S41 family peptidase [Rikenellaceae bacterium]
MKKIFRFKTISIVAGLVLGAALLVSAGQDDFRLGRDMEVLFNLFRDINLLYVDPVDADKLLEDAAVGMTDNLDPYTEYMPEEQMADFEVLTTGKYGGIGSLIRKKGDWVVISQPYKGFPADKAGLKIGDKILDINGEDVKNLTPTEVSGKLRGDPGSTVKLKVEKFATGETATLSIKRERIAISGVPYYGMASDGIGYIRHDDFSEDCANDMRKALEAMRREGKLQGLIVDLRGNGGGILQEAVKIISMFVPKGTEAVSMRGRVKELDAVFRTENEPVDQQLPIVVLCNGGSASASEIVSGALQDLDRAVLMGQRTFGKGLVQSTRPLGHNNYLKITTAKYYIPSGRCIQAIDYTHRRADGSVGVVPDSLIKEFTTRAGRKVYDGGGVTPDVATQPKYASRFVMTVYGMGYIEDFVDAYFKAHPDLDVPVRTYSFTADAYKEFETFMRGKVFSFESETQSALKELKASASREKYDQRLGELITSLEAALPDDISENLDLYRDDLSRLIEDEIVLRRHYYQGVVEHSLTRNDEVTAAVALLRDKARYEGLLHPVAEVKPQEKATAEL